VDVPERCHDEMDRKTLMQGITRDTAMAQKLWNPKTTPKPEPEVPDRSDPGVIESSQTFDVDADATVDVSGNARDENGNPKALW